MAAVGYPGLPKPPNVPPQIGEPGSADPKFTALFIYLIQLGSYFLRIGDVLNNVLKGKLNCTGSFTATANAATTTISDVNIGGNSVLLPMATTANAAAEIPTLYFDTFAKGSCVAHHANNAQTDRIFSYVIIG